MGAAAENLHVCQAGPACKCCLFVTCFILIRDAMDRKREAEGENDNVSHFTHHSHACTPCAALVCRQQKKRRKCYHCSSTNNALMKCELQMRSYSRQGILKIALVYHSLVQKTAKD